MPIAWPAPCRQRAELRRGLDDRALRRVDVAAPWHRRGRPRSRAAWASRTTSQAACAQSRAGPTVPQRVRSRPVAVDLRGDVGADHVAGRSVRSPGLPCGLAAFGPKRTSGWLRGAGARQPVRDAGVDRVLDVARRAARRTSAPSPPRRWCRRGGSRRARSASLRSRRPITSDRGVAQLAAGGLQPPGAGEDEVVLLDADAPRVAEHAAQLREAVRGAPRSRRRRGWSAPSRRPRGPAPGRSARRPWPSPRRRTGARTARRRARSGRRSTAGW